MQGGDGDPGPQPRTQDDTGDEAGADNGEAMKDRVARARRRVLIWGLGAGILATALALWFAPGAAWWFYPFIFVVAAAVVGRIASGIVRAAAREPVYPVAPISAWETSPLPTSWSVR